MEIFLGAMIHYRTPYRPTIVPWTRNATNQEVPSHHGTRAALGDGMVGAYETILQKANVAYSSIVLYILSRRHCHDLDAYIRN